MVKLSGAELDFYIKNRFRVRVSFTQGREMVGYIQRYSITHPMSDSGEMRVGELPSEEFEQKICSGMQAGHSYGIPFGIVKSLEAAAVKDVESSSLPEESRREILGFLKR